MEWIEPHPQPTLDIEYTMDAVSLIFNFFSDGRCAQRSASRMALQLTLAALTLLRVSGPTAPAWSLDSEGLCQPCRETPLP